LVWASGETEMTEQEWQALGTAQEMIGFLLQSEASNRKLRLFACACCRRIWFQFKKTEQCRHGVEVAERYADGQATDRELKRAHEAAVRAYHARSSYGPGQARLAVTFAVAPDLTDLYCISEAVSSGVSKSGWNDREGEHSEHGAHPKVLREIFGNPFRPVTLNPAWLTPTVTTLATAGYEERALPSGELDTARLAVLADALEEAGCDNPDMLNHLRSPGPHVRGCWAVDLLTGRK
jgi:hypothetical protein